MQIEQIKTALQSRPQPVIPDGLEQRVLLAIRHEKQHQETVKGYFYRIFLAASLAFLAASTVLVLEAILRSNLHDLVNTILTDYNAINTTDIFMAILENLPLGSLTLVFCAITLTGLLLSRKTPNNSVTKINLLRTLHS